MSNPRDRIAEFFRRPYGVGAPLNIYMFVPSRLVRHTKTAWSDPRYFVNRLRVVAYQLPHPSEPWLTQDAVRSIKALPHRGHACLRMGQRQEHVWFARHVSRSSASSTIPAGMRGSRRCCTTRELRQCAVTACRPSSIRRRDCRVPRPLFRFRPHRWCRAQWMYSRRSSQGARRRVDRRRQRRRRLGLFADRRLPPHRDVQRHLADRHLSSETRNWSWPQPFTSSYQSIFEAKSASSSSQGPLRRSFQRSVEAWFSPQTVVTAA